MQRKQIDHLIVESLFRSKGGQFQQIRMLRFHLNCVFISKCGHNNLLNICRFTLQLLLLTVISLVKAVHQLTQVRKVSQNKFSWHCYVQQNLKILQNAFGYRVFIIKSRLRRTISIRRRQLPHFLLNFMLHGTASNYPISL